MPYHFYFSIIALCVFHTSSLWSEKISYALDGIHDWHQSILKKYCYDCHNEKKSKGKFRVDNLPLKIQDSPTAERWQKILNAMNASEMPPEDELQLGSEEKADFLDDLAQAMVDLRNKMSDRHGEIAMSRLNQREYRNTIKAFLGVDLNVSQLPSDEGISAFDTNGASLFISSDQLESYLELGKVAINDAISNYQNHNKPYIKRHQGEYITSRYKSYLDKRKQASDWLSALDNSLKDSKNKTAWNTIYKNYGPKVPKRSYLYKHHRELSGVPPLPDIFKGNARSAFDLVNGSGYSLPYHLAYMKLPQISTGGYLGVPTVHPSILPSGYLTFGLPQDWPPGTYKVRFRVALNGKPYWDQRFLEFGVRVRNVELLSVHEVTASMDKPQIIETTIELSNDKKGDDRQIFLRGRGMHHQFHHPRRIFAEAKKANGHGPGYFIWIDWIEAEKISNPKQPLAEGQKILVELLGEPKKEPSPLQLKQGFQKFATAAFRGDKPQDTYIERLLDQYQHSRKMRKTHTEALSHTLSIVLSSPMFIYKAEHSLSEQQQIQQHELAQRLAFFLWSEPADHTLLMLAHQGKLSQPDVLRQQTDRMLNDTRSQKMVEALADQWLHMARLDFFNVNVVKHRQYDNTVKLSARQEIYKTMEYLMQHNQSISDLLSANYVVINSLLADYYGIPNVRGDHFRKVDLPTDSPRGGFLGMAAVHIMGGNGDETSPVERGAWVLRKLLNQPPPPAPANVPQISRLADQLLTTRERLVAHQEEPQCASCHRKIDPIGFGMENFDAVGLWRTENSYEVTEKDDKGKEKVIDSKKWVINASGKLYKGPDFKNFHDLKKIVSTHTDSFAQGFAKAIIEYGMGRDIGFSDKKLIQEIVDQSKKDHYAIRSFIHHFVQHPIFQKK